MSSEFQSSTTGNTVTLPTHVFMAMAACYFGDGPRHTEILKSRNAPSEPARPDATTIEFRPNSALRPWAKTSQEGT